MPKTLLAVDDSLTMRKVLEITFAGDEFRIVTADSSQTALAKLSEKPSAVLIDTVLGGEDGYALSKEVRRKDPSAAIILLSSRHNPYDAAKGKDAGADDFMDKPFDTQQMLDKVKKVVSAKESAPAQVPAATPSTSAVAPGARPQAPPQQVPAQRAIPARSQTLVFGGEAMQPVPPPAAPAAAAAPKAEPSKPTLAGATSGASAGVSAAVNGQMAGKLGELGLSQAQADAVLALSREVVERVVWEVVPQLAEALIKEEIARLTRP